MKKIDVALTQLIQGQTLAWANAQYSLFCNHCSSIIVTQIMTP